GQAQQVLLPRRLAAGRGLLGGQQRLQAGRRLVHGLGQGPLAGDVAGLGAQAAGLVGQGVGQRPPQPGGQAGVGGAAELVAGLVGLQQGVLHDVAGVELAAEALVDLQPGEGAQVLAVALQVGAVGRGGSVHRTPYGKSVKRATVVRPGEEFFSYRAAAGGGGPGGSPAQGRTGGGGAPCWAPPTR